MNSIKLYKPQLYGARPTADNETASSSFIGGRMAETSSCCDRCQQPMVRLIHLQQQHTVAVVDILACTNPSCWHDLFRNGEPYRSFWGRKKGCGVVVGRRRRIRAEEQQQSKATKTMDNAAAASDGDWTTTAVAAAAAAASDTGTSNEWDSLTNGGSSIAIDTLEEQMASIETSPAKRLPSTTKSTKKPPQPDAHRRADDPSSLRYFLNAMPEPLAPSSTTTTASRSSKATKQQQQHARSTDKINAMLERYLAEEEDADLVALIQGQTTTTTRTGDCFEDEEEEEMLSDDQLAFLDYAERIKRAPQQVARYGRGSPLWSIATPPPDVPACPVCGKEQSTCLQLLPSLLQVLQLEVTTAIDEPARVCGMEWGTIVLFHCATENCTNEHPFLVIQKSTDGHTSNTTEQQHKRDQFLLPPGVIEEGAQFSDDDDEE